VYSWLWRLLPGPLGVRLLLAVLLVVAVVLVCFVWVFPAVSPHLPFNQGTVSSSR
jgi:hypothetical protein